MRRQAGLVGRLEPHHWAGLAAVAIYVGAWWLTRGATPTYDEAVYLDLASHPLRSSYYPEPTFLRHPPLTFYLLEAWLDAGLPQRLWPLAWTVPALWLVALTVGHHGRRAWLVLVPVTALPLLLPLLGITPYPPMVAFLALAAWARAKRRRGTEIVAWNLAVLAHELALILLVLRQAVQAWDRIKARETRWRRWAALVVPYPAAVVWGLVMVSNVLLGADPRGGSIAAGLLSPTARELALLSPLHTLVLVVALLALWVWPRRREDPDGGARGATIFAAGFTLISPFYRYLITCVPLLTDQAARRSSRGLRSRIEVPAVILGVLLATGLSAGTILTGVDTANANDVPGLIDHEAGAEMIEPGWAVAVRSPPAIAWQLQQEGWTVTGTGPHSPSQLQLEQEGRTITLVRVETRAQALAVEGVDAYLLPASWDQAIRDITERGYQVDDRAGGLVRLAPTDAANRP